jgi:hypothetical protein
MEALTLTRFTYTGGPSGERSGKLLSALIGALKLPRPLGAYQTVEDGRDIKVRPPSAQSVVASVIRPAMSVKFQTLAVELQLPLTARSVAASPDAYRTLLAMSRTK